MNTLQETPTLSLTLTTLFESLEEEMQRAAKPFFDQAKKLVEKEVKALFARYEPYGLIKDITNTENSTTWTCLKKFENITEDESDLLDLFNDELEVIESHIIKWDDFPYVRYQLLFEYDGKTFTWFQETPKP